MSAKTQFSKIFLFGDSMTQYSFSPHGCFGSMIADLVQRKCDVINRGFSGYNARWCKLILPQLIDKESAKHIAAFTIFLGGNDSNTEELNPAQHVPLEEYKQSLMDMVEYLKDVGISREKIILIAPPPCDEKKWGAELQSRVPPMPLSKFNDITGKYARACIEASKECGTLSVDLYTEMMKNEDWKTFLVDGLHLSTAGSTFLFERLKPLLLRLTANLPMIFPIWSEVDYKNPQAAFSNVTEL